MKPNITTKIQHAITMWVPRGWEYEWVAIALATGWGLDPHPRLVS